MQAIKAYPAISVSVSDGVKAKIEALAVKQGRTKSDIIRIMIKEYFKNHRIPFEEKIFQTIQAAYSDNTNYKVTPELKKQITVLAKDNNKTISEFITFLIRKYSKKKSLQLPDGPYRKPGKTAFLHIHWQDYEDYQMLRAMGMKHNRSITNLLELFVGMYANSKKAGPK